MANLAAHAGFSFYLEKPVSCIIGCQVDLGNLLEFMHILYGIVNNYSSFT